MTGIGDRLSAALEGRYIIDRELGAGGMATVYLAHDVRHDRKVAVKVLNPELGAVLGAERFLAEIRVTANLQHPNLLPLFDSGEAGGLLFYVMPFVEGESLRARLQREKQLSVDEAVRIAAAVAGALDYAHRRHVIHRDLKPENILLHDGQPVIADFGIALAVANAGGTRVTQTGLSLGTPQYMSPEQATGDRVIDARTDIYSLGAVTYEMLAGEAPHTGTSAQAIIAKLMTEEPRALTVLRRNVPPAVDAAVQQALEKLPADRFASAHEFADALLGKTTVGTRGRAPIPSSSRAWKYAAVAGAILSLVSLAANLWQWRRPSAPATLARLSLTLDQGSRSVGQGSGVRFAISNDGAQLVYVGGDSVDQLFVRRLDDLTTTPLAGAEHALDPQFSPDGRSIGFVVDGVLRKIPVAGGAAITIADSARRFSWGDGDVIIVVRPTGLWRVSAAGGTPTQVTHVDSATRQLHAWPHLLPGSRAVLFNVGIPGDSSEVAAAKLADGKVVRLGLYGMNPRYLTSGHVVFARSDGTVIAAPFDARTLRVTGPPVPVLEDVTTRAGGAAQFAVARNGTLVYFSGKKESQLTEVDRRGSTRMLLSTPKAYHEPRFSPDGRRVAVVIGRPVSAANEVVRDPDVWIYELSSGTLTRVTSDGTSTRPVWTADGRRLLWQSFTAGRPLDARIVWRSVDVMGPAEPLLEHAQLLDVSPSGDFLLAATISGTGPTQIIMTSLDSTSRKTEVQRGGAGLPAWARSARISPDGRAWAFSRPLGGNDNASLFVQELPGPDAAPRVVLSKGQEPVWGVNARDLFFRSDEQIIHATLVLAPEPRVVRLDTLFTFPSLPGQGQGRGPLGQYDVSRDGQRLVMVRPLSMEHPPVVVLNWFAEVRQRTALAHRR